MSGETITEMVDLSQDLEEVKAAIEPLCTRVDEITTAQEFE